MNISDVTAGITGRNSDEWHEAYITALTDAAVDPQLVYDANWTMVSANQGQYRKLIDPQRDVEKQHHAHFIAGGQWYWLTINLRTRTGNAQPAHLIALHMVSASDAHRAGLTPLQHPERLVGPLGPADYQWMRDHDVTCCAGPGVTREQIEIGCAIRPVDSELFDEIAASSNG